jgi:hypothetical protein
LNHPNNLTLCQGVISTATIPEQRVYIFFVLFKKVMSRVADAQALLTLNESNRAVVHAEHRVWRKLFCLADVLSAVELPLPENAECVQQSHRDYKKSKRHGAENEDLTGLTGPIGFLYIVYAFVSFISCVFDSFVFDSFVFDSFVFYSFYFCFYNYFYSRGNSEHNRTINYYLLQTA